MVKVKPLIQLNQIMLEGDFLAVLQMVSTMDRRYIDNVDLYDKPTLTAVPQLIAICHMKKRWKAQQLYRMKHLKMVQ